MVSIIVPIYNMERYLARALDSLLAQTCSDWEAILVNDGSTDASAEVAEAYARRDSRFVVVHKENGGLSDARNAGMEHVSGEWVLFLDPDDFFHPQLIALCLEAAERDGSDLIAFTYDRIYRTKNLVLHFLRLPELSPVFKHYEKPPYLVTDDIFQYATEYGKPTDIPRRWAVKHCQVWRCMYQTSRVRDIGFIKGINYEDFPWWSEVLLKTDRCTILNLPLYFYYPNLQSYLFSAQEEHKARSMETGIAAARKLYETAPAEKRLLWEKHFLTPFQGYVDKKRRKLAARKRP